MFWLLGNERTVEVLKELDKQKKSFRTLSWFFFPLFDKRPVSAYPKKCYKTETH